MRDPLARIIRSQFRPPLMNRAVRKCFRSGGRDARPRCFRFARGFFGAVKIYTLRATRARPLIMKYLANTLDYTYACTRASVGDCRRSSTRAVCAYRARSHVNPKSGSSTRGEIMNILLFSRSRARQPARRPVCNRGRAFSRSCEISVSAILNLLKLRAHALTHPHTHTYTSAYPFH